MTGPQAVNSAVSLALTFWCGYMWGKLRGWDRGFKEGENIGLHYGRINGMIEVVTGKKVFGEKDEKAERIGKMFGGGEKR